MTHQFDPAMLPDSDFVPGTLAHLVPANSGRMLDPRRTPIRIVGLDPPTGTFFCEILAFEDRGARWQLPYDRVVAYQFAKDSVLAGPADVREFEAAVRRFDVPLEIAADPAARERTLSRIAEARRDAKVWLDANSEFMRAGATLDLSAAAGDARLLRDCEAYFRAKGLWEIEDAFAAQYVSNPYSGECVKGHRVVLAELGLAEFRDRILRDPQTFEGAWSKAARADHIVARLAFVHEVFARGGRTDVELHRGVATNAAAEVRTGRGFVSLSFSRGVASSMLGPPGTARAGVVETRRIPIERLFMTYLETAHFNRRFQEAEAVMIEDAGTPML